MTDLESAIRHHLISYLSNAISLDEFTAWLVGTTWNIENKNDPDASHLAYAIELALAEHSSGYLATEELRAELRNLSSQVHLDLTAPRRINMARGVRSRRGSDANTVTLRNFLNQAFSLVRTQSAKASW